MYLTLTHMRPNCVPNYAQNVILITMNGFMVINEF